MSHLDKLAWAENEAKAVDEAMDAYLDSGAFRQVPEQDSKGLQHDFVVRMERQGNSQSGQGGRAIRRSLTHEGHALGATVTWTVAGRPLPSRGWDRSSDP